MRIQETIIKENDFDILTNSPSKYYRKYINKSLDNLLACE